MKTRTVQRGLLERLELAWSERTCNVQHRFQRVEARQSAVLAAANALALLSSIRRFAHAKTVAAQFVCTDFAATSLGLTEAWPIFSHCGQTEQCDNRFCNVALLARQKLRHCCSATWFRKSLYLPAHVSVCVCASPRRVGSNDCGRERFKTRSLPNQ
jgi:hypothetical protein